MLWAVAAAETCARLQPVLRNKGSHRNEKPVHRSQEWPTQSNEDPNN